MKVLVVSPGVLMSGAVFAQDAPGFGYDTGVATKAIEVVEEAKEQGKKRVDAEVIEQFDQARQKETYEVKEGVLIEDDASKQKPSERQTSR